MQLVQTFADLA